MLSSPSRPARWGRRVCLAVLAAGCGVAQAAPPVVTVATTTAPVRVDGVMDEALWQELAPIDDFVRYLPTAGGPHGSQTEVRVVQDATTLYIGVRVTGTDARPIARIAPREDINNDDQIGIYVDPFHDGNSGYIFYFNAIGIQQDIRFAYGSWYGAWNTVVRSRGRVSDDGYVLEVAIPFRSLAYPRVAGSGGVATQDWGLMVTRKLPEEGTKLAWPALVPNHPRLFSQAATLAGVRPPASGAGVELMPVLALKHASARPEAGAPLAWQGPTAPVGDQIKPGVDLRVALTPDLGAAVTVNPDFSQVEGDILVVDLNQRFVINYAERRSFFLSGIEAFGDQPGTLVTRSIVEPAYGLKVSGRQGRFSLGLLHAMDLSPGPSTHEGGTPGFDADAVANRMAANSFLRTRWDILGNGYLGLTLANKAMVGAPALVTPPPARGGVATPPPSTGGHSEVAVVDALVPLGPNWTAQAHTAGSLAGDQTDQLQGARAGASIARTPPLGLGLDASVSWQDDDYRDELGWLTIGGHRAASGGLSHTLGIGDGRSTWAPGVYGSTRREDDLGEATELGLSQDLNLVGNHAVSAFGAWRRFAESAAAPSGGAAVRGTAEGPSAGLSYTGRMTHWLKLVGGVDGGRVLDYGALLPAQAVNASAELTLRLGGRTRFESWYQRQWYTLAQPGAPEERADRLYSRLNVQLDRHWGLRLVGSQSATTAVDGYRGQLASLLLTWLQSPGTEAYLGATWTTDDQRDHLEQQVVFAKFSKLFRL